MVEVLASRVLLSPIDFERSFDFYARTLGLHIYREWGSGASRGVVFFLGGGFLELSGNSPSEGDGEKIGLWLQVRDVDSVGGYLKEAGVDIVEAPTDKPWGLREMRIEDPDGVRLVIIEVPADHPLRRR